jgi:FkbM family methyltransferase
MSLPDTGSGVAGRMNVKVSHTKPAPGAGLTARDQVSSSPPASDRPLFGPALTAVRGLLWRALGLNRALHQYAQQVLSLHAQVQALNQGQPFSFRPGTLDERIFQDVVVANEYRLPERFDADDVVLDIGTHIGSFCFAALLRGARHVHGFEAEPGNHALATRNLAAYGDRCRVHNKAVWRSDRKGDVLRFSAALDAEQINTGGGNVLCLSDGAVVQTVSLDDVLAEVTADGRQRVRFLKIDCEGAEFPILLTSRRLSWIDQIHGEFHELGDGGVGSIPEKARVPGVDAFSVEVLSAHLRQVGFSVEVVRNGNQNLGWFFATYQGR